MSVAIPTSPLIQIGKIAHPPDEVMCNSGDVILSARDPMDEHQDHPSSEDDDTRATHHRLRTPEVIA